MGISWLPLRNSLVRNVEVLQASFVKIYNNETISFEFPCMVPLEFHSEIEERYSFLSSYTFLFLKARREEDIKNRGQNVRMAESFRYIRNRFASGIQCEFGKNFLSIWRQFGLWRKVWQCLHIGFHKAHQLSPHFSSHIDSFWQWVHPLGLEVGEMLDTHGRLPEVLTWTALV